VSGRPTGRYSCIPENWYDVTLADDKSFLLDEFMSELQQMSLPMIRQKEALRGYLEKLDNIAFLEVMATWYDTASMNMHVFARTKGGDPPDWYYRRFEKERYWTAWEKVELDITGDHLLAFNATTGFTWYGPFFQKCLIRTREHNCPTRVIPTSSFETSRGNS
jgi:hypothetical protein